ncbi:ThuA domain-containing protein [Paenibacillus sp. FA6]|uniref:ThuA domain-containing protein n=1 Tax=Paenibacillus sp. FA6 TaxID=3413029 RepID=UPI003F6569E8
MKKVLAIVGDFYHDLALIQQSLTEILSPHIAEGKVQLEFCEPSWISERLNDKPDITILFAENRVDPQNEPELRWMTSEVSKQIEQYVEQDGAWIAWHAGMASYDEDCEYVQMLRGSFLYHPSENAEVTYHPVLDKSIPWTESSDLVSELGMNRGSFSFLDEHYFVKCDEANTHVFLRSSSKDGEAPAGWIHTYGQGRVGCITPAHRSEGLFHPSFIVCMRHLFGWTAQID